MLSKNKKHSSTYYDNILPTITNDYNIFELQGFLKHNDIVGKSTIRFKNAMLKCLTKNNNKIQRKQ
jgi:hypothetical protein